MCSAFSIVLSFIPSDPHKPFLPLGSRCARLLPPHHGCWGDLTQPVGSRDIRKSFSFCICKVAGSQQINQRNPHPTTSLAHCPRWLQPRDLRLPLAFGVAPNALGNRWRLLVRTPRSYGGGGGGSHPAGCALGSGKSLKLEHPR